MCRRADGDVELAVRDGHAARRAEGMREAVGVARAQVRRALGGQSAARGQLALLQRVGEVQPAEICGLPRLFGFICGEFREP